MQELETALVRRRIQSTSFFPLRVLFNVLAKVDHTNHPDLLKAVLTSPPEVSSVTTIYFVYLSLRFLQKSMTLIVIYLVPECIVI